MIIRKAEASEFAKLAKLNKELIEDERHPDPMTVEQLARRMREWLQGEYSCYVAEKDEEAVAFYKAYGFRIGCLRMEK
jgi:hypothetical protein